MSAHPRQKHNTGRTQRALDEAKAQGLSSVAHSKWRAEQYWDKGMGIGEEEADGIKQNDRGKITQTRILVFL
jgi:hypothetical protein